MNEDTTRQQSAPTPSIFEGEGNVGVALAEGEEPRQGTLRCHDFRNPLLLSSLESHKLRLRQEEIMRQVAARISVHLHLEFSLKIVSLQTLTYQSLAESWKVPSHFNLFKMEPLRGVSILDISSELGFCLMDRLMGGPGHGCGPGQEISDIEKVLLEQTVQVFMEEWCRHWAAIKELKPVVLGYENKGDYIQAASGETVMLVITMEGGLAGRTGQIQMSVPYAALEPLIKRICQGADTPAIPATPAVPVPLRAPAAPAPVLKWNNCFNDVCVPVTAEWEGLELTARQILALKVGDVLPLAAQHLQRINVRVADTLKFYGRPGAQSGQWAVELTQVIKS
jgi:flagellar motor switch protein FliM